MIEKEDSPLKKNKKEGKKGRKSPMKTHGNFRNRQWLSKKSTIQRVKSPKKKRSPKKRKQSEILPWETLDEDETDFLL